MSGCLMLSLWQVSDTTKPYILTIPGLQEWMQAYPRGCFAFQVLQMFRALQGQGIVTNSYHISSNSRGPFLSYVIYLSLLSMLLLVEGKLCFLS